MKIYEGVLKTLSAYAIILDSSVLKYIRRNRYGKNQASYRNRRKKLLDFI